MINISIIVFIVLFGHTYGRPVNSVPLSVANNRLALNLLNHLSDNQNNVFISPFSISAAFAMLYTGAGGQTAHELADVLGFTAAKLTDQQIGEQFKSIFKDIDSVDTNKYELNVANKMVVQKDFKILDSYLNGLKNNFESAVESVNFSEKPQEIMDSINQWVSRQTHDKIKQLLSAPLDPSTRLVLLNAIYFKGTFQWKFLTNNTTPQTFISADNKQVVTPMMNRTGKFNYTEIPELSSKLLEIPYTGDEISLYIVLPNESQGLKNFNNTLNDFSILDKSINSLTEREVEVFLPKFKIETSYSLKPVFTELGAKSLFSTSADLSGIDGHKDLAVSQAIHKAYIEVNEEGTESAAATVVVVTNHSIPIKPVFKADHPFLFFIRNNSNGLVLFSGHINKL